MIPLHNENTAATVDFSFALQPIIDADSRTIFSYEAFVRGDRGEPASTVVRHIDRIGKPLFDTLVCDRSIGLAAQLGLRRHLSVNLFGQTVDCAQRRVEAVLQAAGRHAFPVQRIVVRLAGIELARSYGDVGAALSTYRQLGFRTAVDFVSTQQRYLSMLVDCQPTFIKLDRRLCAGIVHNGALRSIVNTLVRLGDRTDISVIAAGVESRDEFEVLRDQGISLFQGYYFARPEFELLPAVPLVKMMHAPTAGCRETDGFSPWAPPLMASGLLH